MLDRFKETLRNANCSYTKPRKVAFEALAKYGPMTTAELAKSCGPAIDRATTYRTVELFERLGIINRIWHGFKSQIELSEIFTPHHHHAVCQQCGANVVIVNPELEKLLAQITKRHHFLAISHVIELSGYCKKCQRR
jgi:Fur family transcriptional regulator, ferric uptake regulator